MPLQGNYKDQPVSINDLDRENQAFYSFCGQGELRLQQCSECNLKRYPPTTACPFCACADSTWEAVSGLGTVYSYGEVHHAIQPVFRAHTPYLLLLVELDEQRNEPNEFDGLRLTGNLADSDGELAVQSTVESVGIGTRVRVVFKQMGDEIALPLWTIDEGATQPETPWRYRD